MLRLRQISLFQFKNYENRLFTLEAPVTGICGRNGSGKTNLLDAVHYLCFTRSYFTRSDQALIRNGQNGFRLEGHFELQDQPEKAVAILRETGKKEFLINDRPYERFSQHIGRYPCVVIAPDDAELVTGDSRERRNFLDTLLAQLHPDYLQDLIRYKKLLEQRNSLLKSFAETGRTDLSLLDVLDEQLAVPGDRIFETRKQFAFDFLPAVKQMYQQIALQEEDLVMLYESPLFQGNHQALFRESRRRDLAAQRTTLGIHRDELDIRLKGQPFRHIASQGQRKSLLFALKLAEMDELRKEKGFPPLLLLDDVFEKLDGERMENLLRKVCVENPGQVLITDTHPERLAEQISKLTGEYQLITM